jgi:Recombination endonuclease VII
MRGNGIKPREIPAGTPFGTWVVIREVERRGYNRRFECRCSGCGQVNIRWLSNLVQARTGCLTCTPLSTLTRPGLEAIVAAREAAAEVSDAGRKCLTCQQWKPWEAFSRDKRRRRGRHSNCIECSSWHAMKSQYGIDKSEFYWLLEIQNGTCDLCDEPEPGGQRLSIDHDHSCCGMNRACKKCIRGLLCGNCNRMLGFVEQRPAVAARFSDYLSRRPFASARTGDAAPVLEDVRQPLPEHAA